MAGAETSRRISVALIANTQWESPALYALATPGIDWGTFDVRRLGGTSQGNPFGLPIVESADVVLVSSFWHNWLLREHPDQVASVFKGFERRARTVVGLECEDAFALLLLPPSEMDRYALVIKSHGVYRDRDLYNYASGAPYPGDRWTEKATRLSQPYSSAQLERLRLGLPCLVRDVAHVRRSNRRRARAMGGASSGAYTRAVWAVKAGADLTIRAGLTRSPLRRRPLDVHCVGSVTHTQRIEALRRLEGLGGVRGITGVHERFRGLTLDAEFDKGHRDQIAEQVRPFARPAAARWRYQMDLRRHRIVVAPSGFGELTFRHGEALRAGAALVCPSLAHVEIRFPFEDGRNVVWCRTDLSDLRERVCELLVDEDRRLMIAGTGRRDMFVWERGWRALMDAAIAAPLREALGSG